MKHTKLRAVGVGIAILLLGTSAMAKKKKAGTSKNDMPNVLLLVDTSGSMERMPDGTLPTCGVNVNPNRWGSLVQALTGNLQPYYSCAPQNRSGAPFLAEFGSSIYDKGYALDFYRPLTGTALSSMCGLTHQGSNLNQKTVDATTWSWGTPNSCNFDQANDGQLDITKDLVRYALMTFDNLPDKSTGAAGMWSYYGSGGAKQGNLPLCSAVDYELGARNDNAPDWEGRLVRFPKKDAKLKDVRKQNDELQDILRSMRPYGGTPIDAMMDDAREYLWNDTSAPGNDDAADDDSTKAATQCREEYIILLTDGAPNLDMRPNCAASGGSCPYPDKAYEIADKMNNGPLGGKARVKTFVVGFSVNGSGSFPAPATTCQDWYQNVTGSFGTPAAKASAFATACTSAPYTASGPPAGSAPAACCTLNQISVYGNGGPAFFAENQADLATAMAQILGNVSKGQTSRTVPSYSAVSGATSEAATFLASFDPQPVEPWQGNVSRQRLLCDKTVGSPTFGQRIFDPAADPITGMSVATGDDFGDSLVLQTNATKRRVLLVNPSDISGGKVDGGITLRPYGNTTAGTSLDGFVAETSTATFGAATVATGFTSFFDERVFETTNSTCPRSRDPQNTVIPKLSALDCAKVALGFTLSQPSSLSFGGYDFSKYRCPLVSGVPKCKPLGAVFHANPVFVGPPIAPLRDETYQDFARLYKDRPATLYVSSIDGLLHAFKSDETAPAKKNIEMWSFVPPAALKRLATNMPMANQLIHDGQPVARDIVFERTLTTVAAGSYATTASSGALWHTVLIGSFGEGGRGYYALDVTNPGPYKYDAGTAAAGDESWAAAAPTSTTDRWPSIDGTTKRVPGPQFLWQLVDVPDVSGAGPAGPDIGKDNANRDRVSMFGKVSATPAMTTLYFDPSTSGTGTPREIAVAILPGGYEDDSPGGKCDRALGSFSPPPGQVANRGPSVLTPRNKVRKWGSNCNDPVPGRSLTIVRLDTGEVVRIFSRREDRPRQLEIASRWTDSPLDSPMTGTPVVYPTGIGAVGQKVFVGDADGTLWRFDLSSPNPTKWEASLFLDTQAPAGGSAEDKGQPIAVTPVISTNDAGRLVLSIATGDQEDLDAPAGVDNFVYSVTEDYPSGGNGAYGTLNWYKALTNGERVTGPMTVFDGLQFFATWVPPASSAAACTSGQAYVYQWKYTTPLDGSDLSKGGLPVAFPNPSADASINSPSTGIISMGTELVPGLSIRSLAACSAVDIDSYASAVSAPPPMSGGYELIIPQSTVGAGTVKTNKVKLVKLASVKRPTRIDSWAHIAD